MSPSVATMPKPPQFKSVSELAVHCIGLHPNDISGATNEMKSMVATDPALFHLLVDPLVDSACYEAILAELRKARDAVWNNKPGRRPPAKGAGLAGRGDDREATKHLAAATLRASLFDFTLPNGNRLGSEPSNAELYKASSFYLTQGADMVHKGTWIKLIADNKPDGTPAEKIFSEADMEKFKVQATP